jgi:hypothetical protein
MSKVADFPGIELHTSMKPGFGCAIGMISIKGKNPGDLVAYLGKNYLIQVICGGYRKPEGSAYLAKRIYHHQRTGPAGGGDQDLYSLHQVIIFLSLLHQQVLVVQQEVRQYC